MNRHMYQEIAKTGGISHYQGQHVRNNPNQTTTGGGGGGYNITLSL